MSKNVNLKNSLYERLKREKGEKSFSEAIEEYMKAIPAHPVAKQNVQETTHQDSV